MVIKSGKIPHSVLSLALTEDQPASIDFNGATNPPQHVIAYTVLNLDPSNLNFDIFHLPSKLSQAYNFLLLIIIVPPTLRLLNQKHLIQLRESVYGIQDIKTKTSYDE